MNKHLFNIIIFLLTPILSFSQAKDSVEFKTINNSYYKKVYIGISGGLSYPMGSFSSKNTEFDNSAYAKRGSNINLLDFGYRIGKTLGVGAYYFNSSHEVDLDALIRNQNTIGTVRYLNGSADNYEIKGLMLGLFVSKKDDIIDLDLRFMGGSANIFLPQMTLNYRDLSQNEIFEELYEPISERSMGVGLSAGFRIHLNEYR